MTATKEPKNADDMRKASQANSAPIADAPDEWEMGGDWETIARESAMVVIFENPGDVFIGRFIEEEHIIPDNGDEPFDRYVFEDRQGNLVALNKSYKIERAMTNVAPGFWVRVTYVKDIQTKLNPMKDFRVDVRRG